MMSKQFPNTIYTLWANWGHGWKIEYQNTNKEKVLEEIIFLLKYLSYDNIELREDTVVSWDTIKNLIGGR